MAAPARPYRFPALPEKEEDEQVATRCTRQTCGTCSASAVASCVALCCCPCAVVSCLTLALVKAPYVAGRRCVARIARRPLRKARTRRVRDLDDDDDEQGQGPRRSNELWGDLPRAVVDDGAGDGGSRAKVSSRMDVSEKVWVDMYQVGLWYITAHTLGSPCSFSSTRWATDCDAELCYCFASGAHLSMGRRLQLQTGVVNPCCDDGSSLRQCQRFPLHGNASGASLALQSLRRLS